MLCATLTKLCIAGLLEAIKEFLVGVPAVASGVAAFPGAQLFALRALLTLATICVTPASKAARGRVRLLGFRGVSTPLENLLASGVRLALARRTRKTTAVSRVAVGRFVVAMPIALMISPTLFLDRQGHRFPAASFTQLAQQALISMVNSAPLVSFKPSLQR
jgi:hypothetical protein